MIVSFTGQGTEDVFNGKNSEAARKKCPKQTWSVAFRKLDQLDSAVELVDLATPPGNHLEALSGERKGQHSVRINDQYRICFIWTQSGPVDVEITDYH
jgi:proteic killer suppression protein